MPKRIQLRRTKGWRMPAGAVKVDRSTRWGNPFRVGMLGVPLNSTAVALFRRALERKDLPDDHRRFVFTPERIQADLAGKDLACWCGLCPDHSDGKPQGVHCDFCEPCHADVLLELANAALSGSRPTE